MPPRKRAASAPKTDPDAELPAESDSDQQDPAPEGDSGSVAPDGTDNKPERSDLQTVDAPCDECFPGGWPEGAYAVGCTHGTWTRD